MIDRKKGLIDFDNIRENSVKIGKDWKLSKTIGRLPENVGCITLAVVIMTTANGMYPSFSGGHPKFSISSHL